LSIILFTDRFPCASDVTSHWKLCYNIRLCTHVLTNSVHNMGNTMLLNLAALGVPLRSPSAMLIWNRTITSRGRPDFCEIEMTFEGSPFTGTQELLGEHAVRVF